MSTRVAVGERLGVRGYRGIGREWDVGMSRVSENPTACWPSDSLLARQPHSLFNSGVSAKVLLVVAHPVIASGIETLLRLDGEFEVKRVVSVAEATKQRDWGAQVALVDGTLLAGYTEARIGTPALVLTGNERDGNQLLRKLDDGRGWLRKDATGAELSKAIRAAVAGPTTEGGGIGTLAIVAIALACAIALALVAYLVYLAVY